MRVDLHTHTTASDGALAPAALVALEQAAGTALMAFTDHDTLAGYDAWCAAGTPVPGLAVICGIEFTATHGEREIHVVGLNPQADHGGLRAAVAAQRERRLARAESIAAAFDYLGVRDALAGARRLAGDAAIGRPHFARFLVESGRVRSIDEAFDRYLGHGKPAAPTLRWPGLAEVISWIHAAGGRAVLAHPLAYELGRARLRRLFADFVAVGGDAVEVALPGINPHEFRWVARQVRESGLMASAGSDFHTPEQPWRFPRNIPALPEDAIPVWRDWV